MLAACFPQSHIWNKQLFWGLWHPVCLRFSFVSWTSLLVLLITQLAASEKSPSLLWPTVRCISCYLLLLLITYTIRYISIHVCPYIINLSQNANERLKYPLER